MIAEIAINQFDLPGLCDAGKHVTETFLKTRHPVGSPGLSALVTSTRHNVIYYVLFDSGKRHDFGRRHESVDLPELLDAGKHVAETCCLKPGCKFWKTLGE